MRILSSSLAAAVFLTGLPGFIRAQQQTAPTATVPQTHGSVRATEGAGSTIFGNYCETCHGNPKVDSAPNPAILKQMTPERIYQALTVGDMVKMAQGLTDQQMRDIAEWVGGRKLGATESGDARKMSNVCSGNPPIHSLTATGNWNGWGADLANTRMQPAKAAGLSPAAVSRLQLKWAFGLPAAASVYGQPTIVDGRVFVSSDAGFIYALDADSGCVHWSFQAQTGVRSAITIGPQKPGSNKYAAFFGDIHGNVYSVDATNGELLWKNRIDPQPLARITGGITAYNGRLYVPVASLEEPESSSANYPCCTFRGMVAALDAATGKQVWKTYTIPEAATARVSSDGKHFMGPAGGGVWAPITIDPKRNAVYIVTGNTFSEPDMGRSDSVAALDLDSGKILWWKQDEVNDVWHTGCPQGKPPAGFPPKNVTRRGAPPPAPREAMPATYYCPVDQVGPGPDWDFSAGAMLLNLPNGKSLLVAGQKSGLVWAHDPDKKGELVWRSDVSRGQIVFGGGADQENAYFAMRGFSKTGPPAGVVAVRLSDGMEKWYTPVLPQEAMKDHPGLSAAVTVIPGVVFTSGLDGMLRAFATSDGKAIWEYDTTQEFETVNGVKGHGGSIGSAGATVAGGMVFVDSGYTGFQGGSPGNVLLAFAQ